MDLISEQDARKKLGGASRTAAWELWRTDPRAPKPVMLGRRKTFVASELDDYVAVLVAERDATNAGV